MSLMKECLKYFIDSSNTRNNSSASDDSLLKHVLESDVLLAVDLFKFKYLAWTLFLTVLSAVVYWLFYIPYVWKKDLTEAGYSHVKETNNKARINTINRLRRTRKLGDKILPPFPNGWYRVYESADLKSGQAVNVDCLGQNFVVFRSEKGEAHVLDAYCPHLGANLGVGGVVKGDCIECPFHHWTFRGSDGVCNNIPYSASEIIPKTARVKHWTSKEVNDAIFVWYHAEDEEPWVLTSIKEVDTGEFVYHGHNDFLVSCHIQDIPENGADVAHLSAVHEPFITSGVDMSTFRMKFGSFIRHMWTAQWQTNPDDTQHHIALLNLTHAVRLFNKVNVGELDVKVEQIGPSYVRLHLQSSYGPMLILQTVTPVEPLVQRVIHRFYAPRHLGWYMKFAVFAESIMFERDMAVWNSKIYIDSPCIVKEDRLIKSYRQWYSQFYSENSTSFAQAKEDISW